MINNKKYITLYFIIKQRLSCPSNELKNLPRESEFFCDVNHCLVFVHDCEINMQNFVMYKYKIVSVDVYMYAKFVKNSSLPTHNMASFVNF